MRMFPYDGPDTAPVAAERSAVYPRSSQGQGASKAPHRRRVGEMQCRGAVGELTQFMEVEDGPVGTPALRHVVPHGHHDGHSPGHGLWIVCGSPDGPSRGAVGRVTTLARSAHGSLTMSERLGYGLVHA